MRNHSQASDSDLSIEVARGRRECIFKLLLILAAETLITEWIYGGAFSFGSTSMYDGTIIVERSIALGAPIIYVAMNYRVSGM